MSFDPGLKIGEVITHDRLLDIFKCGNMGGMRRSQKTNTLVIISDHTKGLYEDKWVGDVLHYTGMGKNGDQSLNFAQNRTLAESNENGVDVHLFEVFKEKEYVYMGQVKLVEKPYQEVQKGEDGVPRKVWIFPVKVIQESAAIAVDSSLIQTKYEEKEKQAKRLDNETLAKRAKESQSEKTSVRNAVTTIYERNAYVSEYAKRRANGICQLCEREAPFKNKDGEPYLETHHIEWLSRGGTDTLDNTVALCPNCHRKMHSLDLEEDRSKLKKVAIIV
ncbi:HNH endonuclease [Thermosinus carboxydivorans Nor1]|uniref:HNH endonuclease n=1 Tax=Thermosinus carboxydivorans Nor1 TaxID=401526 RepID=A1HS87_9FIRM|nr:HNH endonuclease [Thermosinus carboxydivorans]EAX47151.1 HNH endonuclease [Thermosinus carboxydivorans Nor1]